MDKIELVEVLLLRGTLSTAVCGFDFLVVCEEGKGGGGYVMISSGEDAGGIPRQRAGGEEGNGRVTQLPPSTVGPQAR